MGDGAPGAITLISAWAASLADTRRLSSLTVTAYTATLHRFVAFVANHTGGLRHGAHERTGHHIRGDV